MANFHRTVFFFLSTAVAEMSSMFFNASSTFSSINCTYPPTKAVFGSCKSISRKYSIFQKCYFPEMLFSGKKNDFMCLAVTKFILRKINSGVWFLQTFLQKMLYMPNFPHTSSTVNMQIINNSTIIHRKSKTQQKNSSNRCRRDRRRRSVQRRRR